MVEKIKKFKKFLVGVVVLDLIVSTTMLISFKTYQYKQEQAIKQEEQRTVKLMNDVSKMMETAEQRYNEGTNRTIASYMKDLDTISQYMTNKTTSNNQTYVNTMLAELDWELASNENLSLLNATERNDIEQTIAMWKAGRWDRATEQRKIINAIMIKYKH